MSAYPPQGLNHQVVLAERPKEEIIIGQTFKSKTVPAPVPADLKDGEALVENLYLSLDPAMRGWIRDARSYMAPVQIGEVMRGSTIARVAASRSNKVKEGDYVTPQGVGWQEYAVVPDDKLGPPVSAEQASNLPDMLSVLGGTGLTAYFGMTQIGEPKPGELVVVSGAAGATGSVAGQIAKLKGATVVGIAGSDEKAKFLIDELGFDVALNYKSSDFKERFKDATKDYIDVFFDNVGGEILDMALGRAKPFARFVMCGGISQYNAEVVRGPKNILNVITMRIKMQGFIILDHVKEFPDARKELAQWLAEGKIKRKHTIVKGGLKVAEEALVGLFKGINTGKLIVEVKDPREARL